MSDQAPLQQAKSESTSHSKPSTAFLTHVGGEPSDRFADNRPQAALQRQLQQTANNSKQARQHQLISQLANSSAASRQLKSLGKTNVQRAEQPVASPNGSGLPGQLKRGIEALSGMGMDHVSVHYNSVQPAQLNAHAYAQGSAIHVAPGQEKHLPHEAWHVVQQAQGRVKPTLQMKSGVPLNDDVGLESEADVMGAKALEAGVAGITSGVISAQMKPVNANISAALPIQLLAAVFSRAAFADPATYLAGRFADTQINEDAGSGGIQDEPVRKLVLELARAPRREVFATRLDAAGGNGAGLATTLRNNVFDRTTAHTWVIQNTLAISAVAPWALTIENAAMAEAPNGPVHTFHRDYGKVVLTEPSLTAQGVNNANERTARRDVLNGPGGAGWIRGHNGVLNKKHRFINHIHVDKDAPADAAFEIYDADNVAVGQTAENFNLVNRAGFSDANDGRVALAAVAVEGSAKRLSWEAYEATLPAEVAEPEDGVHE
jgi:hypothetical protein